jgi:hypothetical protein
MNAFERVVEPLQVTTALPSLYAPRFDHDDSAAACNSPSVTNRRDSGHKRESSREEFFKAWTDANCGKDGDMTPPTARWPRGRAARSTASPWAVSAPRTSQWLWPQCEKLHKLMVQLFASASELASEPSPIRIA